MGLRLPVAAGATIANLQATWVMNINESGTILWLKISLAAARLSCSYSLFWFKVTVDTCMNRKIVRETIAVSIKTTHDTHNANHVRSAADVEWRKYQIPYSRFASLMTTVGSQWHWRHWTAECWLRSSLWSGHDLIKQTGDKRVLRCLNVLFVSIVYSTKWPALNRRH